MPSSINPLCVPMLTVGRLFISSQGFHGFSVPCGVIYVTHCIFLNMKCPIHQAYDWLKRHHVATTSQEKIDCNLKPYSNNILYSNGCRHKGSQKWTTCCLLCKDRPKKIAASDMQYIYLSFNKVVYLIYINKKKAEN